MNRKEAIEFISKRVGNDPIISANGFISRDLFDVCDKKSNELNDDETKIIEKELRKLGYIN